MKITRNNAFSLVELSIVLVILGLLTGGILTGQSLIRAAELRAITTEYGNFQTAIHTFKNKYYALPGDIRNATSFWGDNTTHCSDTNIADGTPGTCNGDGDGLLDHGPGGNPTEEFMLWNHLSNAGLIGGTYSGINGPNNATHSQIGENVPPSKINASGWTAVNINISAGNNFFYALDYGNALMLGEQETNAWTDNGFITPTEAWGIDTKIDDGRPGIGKVIAIYWNNSCSTPNGAAVNTNFDAEYNLTSNDKSCAFLMRDLF